MMMELGIRHDSGEDAFILKFITFHISILYFKIYYRVFIVYLNTFLNIFKLIK